MMKISFWIVMVLLIPALLLAQDNELSYAEQESIPPWVREVFQDQKLDKDYTFCNKINPFYQRGDFNGDRKLDLAILIKEKTTGKLGIAIFHSGSRKVFILGAGKSFSDVGDNFSWMDYWFVYGQRKVYQSFHENKPPPVLRGEALLVGQSESSSEIIYWTGRGYSIYLQTD